MKLVVLLVLTFISLTGPGDIARINTLKAEAKKAFQSGDLKTAIAKYRLLVDSLGVTEDEVLMNLSNAYFRTNDTTNAPSTYQQLTQSKNSKIKSLANMQLGVLANRRGNPEEALNWFKQALKAAPDNDLARYNYEMVKKKLEEKKKQDQRKQDQNKDKKENKDDKNKKDPKDKKDQQDKKDQKDQKDKKDQDKKDKEEKDKKDQENKDQKDKDQKEKDQKDKDQKDKKGDKSKEQKEKEAKEQQEKEDSEKNDKKEIPPNVSEKLKDMQMSEQKAKMILEAMKNQEVQYLQQNKRKATKPRESGKPDW